jgi:glutamate carboxypeptidase
LAASPTDVFCDRLQALVDIDSPSEGTEQEAVAERIRAWLAPIGCTQEWVEEPDNPARSLVITLPGDGGPAVALLGHPDTVFALGTTARWSFRRDGDLCTGPGVADMKGGLVLAAMAVERLAAMPERPFSELRLLICADEEVRLRAPAVAEHARGAAAALVFECGRRNGDMVSARKGALWRTLYLHGRPAHAGADTALGRSAVSALAHEILRIEGLVDGRPDMTSVVTTVTAGDSANTVPGEARATTPMPSWSGRAPTTACAPSSPTAAPGRRCRSPRSSSESRSATPATSASTSARSSPAASRTAAGQAPGASPRLTASGQ